MHDLIACVALLQNPDAVDVGCCHDHNSSCSHAHDLMAWLAVLQITVPNAVAASYVGYGTAPSNFGQDPTPAVAGMVAAAVSHPCHSFLSSHSPAENLHFQNPGALSQPWCMRCAFSAGNEVWLMVSGWSVPT